MNLEKAIDIYKKKELQIQYIYNPVLDLKMELEDGVWLWVSGLSENSFIDCDYEDLISNDWEIKLK